MKKKSDDRYVPDIIKIALSNLDKPNTSKEYKQSLAVLVATKKKIDEEFRKRDIYVKYFRNSYTNR